MSLGEIVTKLDKAPVGMYLTVRIVVSRQFKIRAWASQQLFKLAGHVLGCPVTIEMTEVQK